jgi:hypothetical protein
MIGIQENKITMVPLMEAVAMVRWLSMTQTRYAYVLSPDERSVYRHREERFRESDEAERPRVP